MSGLFLKIKVVGHKVSSSNVKDVSPSFSTVFEDMQLTLEAESKRHRTTNSSFLDEIFVSIVGSKVIEFCFNIADRVNVAVSLIDADMAAFGG